MIFLTFITHYTFSDQSKANKPPNKIDHFLSDFNLFIPFEAIRFLPSLNHQGNGKKLLQGILSARF
jgi:hypothetical protein